MEKITLKLDGELLAKINDRMVKNGCASLSQCARELIELGLKIEEAASLQEDENTQPTIDPMLLEILKTGMIWSLETRLLVRFLVEKKTDIDPQQMNDYMKKAKERAAIHVADFIQNTQKSSAGNR